MTDDQTDRAALHDNYDRLRRRVLWSMPTGLYVIGSRSNTGVDPTRVNLMTANLVVQVCVEPKMVGVAIDATAVTHALVADGGVFSISLLPRSARTVVRRFVKAIEADAVTRDSSGKVVALADQAVTFGVTGAPLLSVAAATIECAVRQQVDLGSHSFFIGEVVSVTGSDDDLELLRMEDTRMNYGG